jgi:serine/threonine protein kinase
MTLQPGQNVLRGRYRLLDAPLVTDKVSVSWPGAGPYDTQYLIKAWPFESDTPDEYKRALWDAELRTMYRVGSSPGAEESILVIRDAGLDRDARCFIMVLEAMGSSGYAPLSDALRQRGQFGWLSNQDAGSRRELWQGLQLIANGLQLLHEQNILHRNLTAEAVLFNAQLGPRSFRLGGFEWSIRLGQLSSDVVASVWSTPPEFSREPASGYRRETDWYAFGMLAARCLLSVELAGQLPLPERHTRVLRETDKATARQLSDLERTFVQRLIDPDPSSRLTRGYEVRTTLKEIIASLDRGASTGSDDRPLVVVINPGSASDLIERAQSLGFVPNPDEPHEMFSPGSLVHVTNLTNFIQPGHGPGAASRCAEAAVLLAGRPAHDADALPRRLH